MQIKTDKKKEFLSQYRRIQHLYADRNDEVFEKLSNYKDYWLGTIHLI